jgi:DNA-binding response OmpR family regulator
VKEILLVESNPVLLTARLRTLEATGYHASGATGSDALKATRWGPFDLLIVDMDAIEAFESISSATVPVLLMVTGDTLASLARSLPMGLWAFLVKPFIAREFKSAVSGALDRGETIKAGIQTKIAPLLNYANLPLRTEAELGKFFDEILEMVAAETEADTVSILVPDEETGEPIVRVRAGLDIGGKEADEKIGQWVMRSSAPLVMNNGNVAIDPAIRELASGIGASSILAVPLAVGDRVVGIINTIKVDRGRFTQGSFNFLSILSQQAAPLIQNGHLMRNYEKQLKRLERILMKSFISQEEGQKE